MSENIKEIKIFTDGGAIGNPGPGGWGAIILDESSKKVIELGGKEDKTTNNRMEMMAIIKALENAGDGLITVHSDSKYTITGITQWVFGWEKNDWKTKSKTDVLNNDLWQKQIEVTKDKDIEYKHVEGHVGIAGNERVDVIANSFARGKDVSLFKGDLKDYSIDLLNMNKDEEASLQKSKTKSKSSAKAYSYISMVDGKVEKHSTWGECEARVKGKKARFKKTFSKEDEEKTIKEWVG
ncbi:MAG: ribonuclease [Patescibacteria group bacterium]|nr:ribonuclease [Patescibacteria group bacterium]